MNKEQQELVDRAYDKYLTYLNDNQIFINSWDMDSFVKSCTKDSEDAKMWGLTIEERELTEKERYDIWISKNYETGFEYNPSHIPDYNNPYWEPTPTKLITVTYNNEKIESYE